MLPIGIEDFREIRTLGFYYVDKTGLISELLDNWGKVNLFTRPRRFGKSLNMSMLQYFFEYGCDKTLFEGLEIAQETEICEAYMGRFPVISLSLKGVNEGTYEEALGAMRSIVGEEALRFRFLLESDQLAAVEKKQYQALIDVEKGSFSMSNEVLKNSLLTLSSLLYKHYDHKVIILIDEYDVPLDKAQQYGYYDQMVMMIRNMFGQALKTNKSLYFSVLTGCLRISKESIFTGLNNMKILSITNVRFDEHFGFNDDEVLELLRYYGMEERKDTVKQWYDGYRFGNADVYCPWDVLNYVDDAREDAHAQPQAYWLNTSENNILKTFLQMATPNTMQEIDLLINGESVRKKISQELTYKELYDNLENLWSVLFTTGYLTQVGRPDGDIFQLAIPNLEVKKIFVERIKAWFDEEVHKDSKQLEVFCEAFVNADAKGIEEQLNNYLDTTVGIHDYSIRQALKENYYHGLLVGLLGHHTGWLLTSNEESGDGYCDIMMKLRKQKIGIIIEVKCPKDGDLEAACRDALQQIEAGRYEARLLNEGMTTVLKYGIAFYKKECKVCMGRD